ncbi:lactonase family protein [Sporobolomyces salmoneus]|uniref:lactonase family protein n=1 Tax=Sporobolomyces salmoneus TaxID=183962 RepID=UPI00317C539F
MPIHHLLVGTFNTNLIATLAFDSSAKTLQIVAQNDGQAPHSWLALNEAKDRLYATSWTEPPGLASYRINPASSTSPPTVSPINSVRTAARSGYVCVSAATAYSAGGPTGEVFEIDQDTGAFREGKELQKLDFVGETRQKDDGGVMDFGGLRHGSHSFDLSPDGKLAYAADIGRNAVFVFRVNDDGSLALTEKNIAPRSNDGPRHVTPHPNGDYVYSLQEHSSMVDVFRVDREHGKLTWVQGVKIIPQDDSPTRYWADEVRVSPSQKYLYCSTRGLEPATKGWVAVYELSAEGLPTSDSPITLYETATSGGWANAVQPAPGEYNEEGIEYLALTDSEEGLVFILAFDGKKITEVARTKLEYGGDQKVVGAATAVWL